jgi:hypothetical protein
LIKWHIDNMSQRQNVCISRFYWIAIQKKLKNMFLFYFCQQQLKYVNGKSNNYKNNATPTSDKSL